jgi:hypothetical protein
VTRAAGLVLALALVAACGSRGGDDPVVLAGSAKLEAHAQAQAQLQTDPKTADAGSDDLALLTSLANTAHKAKFPDADAYVALDRDDVTLAADGSVSVHHKSIVKVLDPQRGKAKFADVHVPFDADRETLVLHVARTVNADGVPHSASPDEIGDIVPPELADAQIYASARERVISFPAVDTGSIVELEYTRTTKPGADAPGGGELALARWDPIGSRIVTITTPATAPAPRLAVLGTDAKPTESNGNGTRTYTYAIADLPDRHAEGGAPPDATTLPRLLYGFQPDWKAALAPIADRFLAVAVPAAPNAAIQTEADELVAGVPPTDTAARAAKLYAFVALDIRTIELPLGTAGYEPHAPAVVLANRYGDPRDKVALLLALAAAEGISGTPVLVRARHVRVDPSVPTVAQFDYIIGKLSIDGKDTWIDPSESTGRFGFAPAGEDNLVLPVVRGGAELGARPVLPPDTSVSHTTAKLALTADGTLDAHYTYQLTGEFATQTATLLRPLAGETLARFFQEAAGRVAAGATDAGHEISNLTAVTGPLEISQHVSVPGYAQPEGPVRVVELPPLSLAAAVYAPPTGMSTRTTPLMTGAPNTQTADVTVEIPAGWKVAYVPPDESGSADGVSFRDACTADGQVVTCHREITSSQVEIASAQYPAFRDAFAKLRAYERRIVVLTRA